MGTKKFINTSSSPPITYLRHCDDYQQDNGNKNNNNNTCCSVNTTTNTMFTKLRNYFTHIRKSTSSTHRRRNHNHRHHEKLTNCNSITTTTTHSNSSNSTTSTSSMLNIIGITMLVVLALINTATSNPVFVDNPSLAQFQSGRNIRHLPCIVRKSGRSGVCMFAIDCIKQNGTHLGTCIDRFYFGSCCDIKEDSFSEIADNSIDQNTISHHFTPESSTMPTSALFKFTTLSPTLHFGNISSSSSSSSNTVTQQDVTQMLNSVTQTFTSTTTLGDASKPTTLITNTNSQKPIKATTTAKPSTHKHSQFVIRTTAKPIKIAAGSKPSHYNTTTKKKTTHTTTTTTSTTAATSTKTTTTTRKPILTTTDTKLHKDELQMEVTTTPTKLFTYQIVETTQFTPTEPTKIIDFVTTERIPAKITKKPHTTTSTTTTKTTTEAARTTTTTTTTEVPRTTTTAKPRETTTPQPKPQTTRKPTIHKRTTVKPTRKPVTTITDLKIPINATSSQLNNSTTETTTHKTTTYDTTIQGNKTTNAPRPKPKPTAIIVKVPKPITTTSTTTTTTTTSRPTPYITTPETTTESKKSELLTTTTIKIPTTTVTTETTQTITTTTTTKPSTSTATKATYKPIITSTHKPGLVTWTNIDGEPVVESNKPINSDWIPVTTEVPLNTNKLGDESSTEKITYEESNVSVSSSVSAMMNNHTVIISAPQKPVLLQKPTTSTASPTSTATNESTKTQTDATSTTTKPSYKPSTTTPSTSTQNPTSTSTLTTTEQPESSSTTVAHQFTTEGITSTAATSSSSFTTEEFTTESLILNSTTQSPVSNGLEGVDYRQVCGRRMFPEPRIVGGSNAAFGRWPWQISLRQWRTSTYLHKCGAALLNENWAITAAHCVDNVPPSDLLLRLGEYDLAEEEEPYGYQERRVQIVASHPQFDPRTFEYDLALLRFYEPVVFQPNIIPVCVPEDDENFIGQTAFVTGWGRLYEDGPLPSVLQEVAVPVINNTICESMYRSAGYIEHIPHIFICAGWKKGGYDSCEGDSGGPMVLQRESDKRFQLGGVISWGIGCAEANQPGVYTRISEFRDWINQILQF